MNNIIIVLIVYYSSMLVFYCMEYSLFVNNIEFVYVNKFEFLCFEFDVVILILFVEFI